MFTGTTPSFYDEGATRVRQGRDKGATSKASRRGYIVDGLELRKVPRDVPCEGKRHDTTLLSYLGEVAQHRPGREEDHTSKRADLEEGVVVRWGRRAGNRTDQLPSHEAKEGKKSGVEATDDALRVVGEATVSWSAGRLRVKVGRGEDLLVNVTVGASSAAWVLWATRGGASGERRDGRSEPRKGGACVSGEANVVDGPTK